MTQNLTIAMVVELITPELAQAYLTKNSGNRNIRPRVVARLARSMTAGRWTLTGEAIKFDRNGRLIDGQHRLSAIVQAGVAVEIVVMRGLPPEAANELDTGTKQNSADRAHRDGIANANMVCAVAGMVKTWQSGSRTAGAFSKGSGESSYSEIREILRANPRIEQSCSFISGKSIGRFCPPSIAAFCHALFSEISEEAADKFMIDLASGAGLEAGDPVFRLRESLSHAKYRKMTYPRGEIITMLFRAWNARAEDRKLTKMYRSKSAVEATTLPKLSGLPLVMRGSAFPAQAH